MSAHVQGVWSAFVSSQCSNDIKRWLYSDAGSGILFNLGDEIDLGDCRFSSGAIMLGVSKQAQSITLPPGAQLAGFRLHPAVGFGLLGAPYQQAMSSEVVDDIPNALHLLSARLMKVHGHYARMVTIYRWLNKVIDFFGVMPNSLKQALTALQMSKAPGQLSADIALSQRQLERQFQKWIGITPKHYHRILRVKRTLNHLKYHPDVSLVELALNNGFSDQAHMTRELKQIAKIAPRLYSQLARC